MKKCPDCERDIDKMTFACEYCGKLVPKEKPKASKPTAAQDKEAKRKS